MTYVAISLPAQRVHDHHFVTVNADAIPAKVKIWPDRHGLFVEDEFVSRSHLELNGL